MQLETSALSETFYDSKTVRLQNKTLKFQVQLKGFYVKSALTSFISDNLFILRISVIR